MGTHPRGKKKKNKKNFYHSTSQCTELNYVRLSVVTLNNLRLYHISKDTTQYNV